MMPCNLFFLIIHMMFKSYFGNKPCFFTSHDKNGCESYANDNNDELWYHKHFKPQGKLMLCNSDELTNIQQFST